MHVATVVRSRFITAIKRTDDIATFITLEPWHLSVRRLLALRLAVMLQQSFKPLGSRSALRERVKKLLERKGQTEGVQTVHHLRRSLPKTWFRMSITAE